MGNGTFNLMISLLPGRVIKLLEFIGFSGNKQMGMQDLMAGAKMTGLRQVLCVMTLLGYHLIVCYVLSHQEGDLEFCEEVLNQQLSVSVNNSIKTHLQPHTTFSALPERRLVSFLQGPP